MTKGPKIGSDAAKRGGQATAAKYAGTDHFKDLGKASAAKQGFDAEHMRELGKLGGAAIRDKRGITYLREIASRGGSVSKRS